MKRFLSLLTGGVLGLVAMWGCSTLPPPSGDDDDNGSSKAGNSNSQGGASSTAGKAGNGSAGSGTPPACVAPSMLCSGVCKNLAADSQNCGACGTLCNGQVCSNGMCKATCDAGLELCPSSGACVAPGTCGLVGTGGASAMGGTGGTPGIGGQGASGGVGAQGGTISSGGVGAEAGSGTSGSAGTGTTMNPAGYWTYNDWHGCAWTGIDTDTTASVRTTIMPQDFTTAQVTDGYCVSGAVGNTYDSVGLVGFNLNQPAAGTSCVYDPASATTDGPPGVVLTQTGIAVNFSKTGAFTLRVQIQAQDGATNKEHRWCATIKDAAGPVFVKYTDFYTQCWNVDQHPTDMSMWGTQYDLTVPASAIVFTVPGVLDTTTPYNFCINGFAAGNSAADAPTGGTQGSLTGTIGGSGATDLDFQRVKVKVGGKSYIIQNNNWGNPGGSNQTLTYKDNSFKVTAMDGSGSSAPASFPSIYIGANGDTQAGLFSTTSDDHLPKQVSAITSLMTTFRFTTTGNMNAAYDIWFSDHAPTACYGDAISGFVMLWFHQPSGFHPIGDNPIATNVSIGGSTWNVYKGTRGTTGASQGSCAVQNSGAPVISYTATSDMPNVQNLDLKPFFTDATSRGISSSWYLTDLFAGFEIWSGGTNAEVKEFTATVAP